MLIVFQLLTIGLSLACLGQLLRILYLRGVIRECDEKVNAVDANAEYWRGRWLELRNERDALRDNLDDTLRRSNTVPHQIAALTDRWRHQLDECVTRLECMGGIVRDLHELAGEVGLQGQRQEADDDE